MKEASSPAGLVCVGLQGLAIDDDIRSLLDRGVGGVILFARNVETPEQVARLCHDLKQYAGRPLLVMTDQEGGSTARLRDGFTPLPAMRCVGATGDPATARRVGEVIGRELRAVGIDVALAPVLDVDTNPDSPVIGPRSLSGDPDVVASLGCALIEGLQSQGVAACAKHFPGHGDTAQDSHYALPRLPHAMDRLERVELLPFCAAARQGVALMMSAHIVFDAIDPDRPGTLSRPVLEGVLRDRVGFTGVTISDCLEMKAVADPENLGGDAPPREHVPAAVLAGIGAGLDLALVSHTAELAHASIDRLEAALASGGLDAGRVADATNRVARLMQQYAGPPVDRPDLSVLNSAASNAVTAPLIKDAAALGHDPTQAFTGGS
ncbi:MAG: beta-N-acetylhexosaminidase [Phycisphaerales bacterium JB063]